MIPGKKIQDELPMLKKFVRKSKNHFSAEYKNFNEFRKFVYETSITEQERDVNNELYRPNIETNVLTAYQSRLCGEFSKQEPSIEVSAEEQENVDPRVISTIEGHFRHIMDEAKNTNTQYHTYRDSLSGGFCSMSSLPEYANEKSFKYVIKIKKSRYPTMCGYDPLATDPHKGDGAYSFQCYPLTEDDFKLQYDDVDTSDIKFPSCDAIEGFSWSFNNSTDNILLICRLFLKKKQKVKIFELADGKVYTEKEYKKFLKDWENEQHLEPAPIVAQERTTTITTIHRYVFIDTKVLEYKKTDFKYLPDVFVDGDSIDLYDDSRGSIKQHTRPYCYNAKGAQQLKNLGVQCLAGYLESMAQHKYIVKKEAIPQEKSYLDALTKPQKASTIVVNAFKDNNPNMPIPEPIIPVNPQLAPPEIANSITMADQIIQNELGSFDAQLGINNNQLSSLAIQDAATQSNAAAMPYVTNYVQSLNQIALVSIDYMSKYYKGKMTIPAMDKEGKRTQVKINQEGGVDFDFDSNIFKVKVTAGVNFAIQKSRAINQLTALCQAIPGFAQFIQSKGLAVVIDNLEMRGSDILKELVEEYEKEQAQMQQQQMQMANSAMQSKQQAMQNNPNVLNAHTKAFSAQVDAQVKAKQVQIEEEELKTRQEIANADRDAAIARAQAEELRANAQLKMAHLDQKHRHGKDTVETLHTISQSHLENSRHEKENTKQETSNDDGKENGE